MGADLKLRYKKHDYEDFNTGEKRLEDLVQWLEEWYRGDGTSRDKFTELDLLFSDDDRLERLKYVEDLEPMELNLQLHRLQMDVAKLHSLR